MPAAGYEYVLERLIADGACIDAFGVGTRMGVSADAPYLDMVYKMVRMGNRSVRKQSEGKTTLAGEKQVFRKTGADGAFAGDIIGLRDELPQGTTALLTPVMAEGRPVATLPDLETIRSRVAANFARLDERYQRLSDPGTYPVAVSEGLAELQKTC